MKYGRQRWQNVIVSLWLFCVGRKECGLLVELDCGGGGGKGAGGGKGGCVDGGMYGWWVELNGSCGSARLEPFKEALKSKLVNVSNQLPKN